MSDIIRFPLWLFCIGVGIPLCMLWLPVALVAEMWSLYNGPYYEEPEWTSVFYPLIFLDGLFR